jgi:hypothetical protein
MLQFSSAASFFDPALPHGLCQGVLGKLQRQSDSRVGPTNFFLPIVARR